MKLKIRPLPQNVIAKIAAGEVIERPVYAVKELVENALDANADTINVQIEDSGLKKISVIDNGGGMTADDLKESFKLHTTSKIATEDHLSNISTLGFRGEALASIATISNIVIQSRTKKSTSGTGIEIKNGKLQKTTPVGMPIGTTVIVSDLFHSVPGRKKFLKSSRTEFRHILSLMSHFAIVNPHVHFSLTHNKKLVFDLPKTTNILERIKYLLGKNVYLNLLPVTFADSYISVSGFLARPQETTSTINKQFLFVNKRRVTDKLISQAVKDAYGNLIDSKAYPIFILFLSLPYEFVDVNVHPRKEQIRFVDHKLVYESVYKTVAQILTENNVVYYSQDFFGLGLSDKPTKSLAGKLLKEEEIPWDVRSRNELTSFSDIVQLHNLYLITQTKFGIVLIDQHAAHERIIYEQFYEAFKKKQTEISLFKFSKPIVIELSLSETELLNEHLELFEQMGFTFELFKDKAFLLHTVPMLFQDRNLRELISEILDDLDNERKKDVDNFNEKMIAYLACRAAVKAGESLSKKQAKELLEKLEKTNNNSTCPHGRPTRIIIDINQLHKMFKRK